MRISSFPCTCTVSMSLRITWIRVSSPKRFQKRIIQKRTQNHLESKLLAQEIPKTDIQKDQIGPEAVPSNLLGCCIGNGKEISWHRVSSPKGVLESLGIESPRPRDSLNDSSRKTICPRSSTFESPRILPCDWKANPLELNLLAHWIAEQLQK